MTIGTTLSQHLEGHARSGLQPCVAVVLELERGAVAALDDDAPPLRVGYVRQVQVRARRQQRADLREAALRHLADDADVQEAVVQHRPRQDLEDAAGQAGQAADGDLRQRPVRDADAVDSHAAGEGAEALEDVAHDGRVALERRPGGGLVRGEPHDPREQPDVEAEQRRAIDVRDAQQVEVSHTCSLACQRGVQDVLPRSIAPDRAVARVPPARRDRQERRRAPGRGTGLPAPGSAHETLGHRAGRRVAPYREDDVGPLRRARVPGDCRRRRQRRGGVVARADDRDALEVLAARLGQALDELVRRPARRGVDEDQRAAHERAAGCVVRGVTLGRVGRRHVKWLLRVSYRRRVARVVVGGAPVAPLRAGSSRS